jgi:CPA2 family monovalent cation:H+ antiporter-2
MEHEGNLLRDFAVIMAVAGAAIFLMRQFKQPPILGYLIAGVLVGPFTFANPVVEDVDIIRRLADVGLVLLLFGLGLEFGWERIRQVGPKVLFIGAVEMTLIVAMGFQTGIALGWTDTEAIFLGAAISISSSAVIVKMLGDYGDVRSPRGRLIVGILVVEDFGAVILLSILSGVTGSDTGGLQEIGLVIGRLVLFTGGAVLIGTLVAPRLIGLIARTQTPETMLIISLAMAFGLALLGEILGISAAAGAFLIGAVIGDTKFSAQINERMEPVRDMFGALFFVSIGMLVDVGQFGDFIGPALVVTAVYIVGKVVANTAAVFVTGTNGTDALRVATGMPQSGEMSLAIVKVGTDNLVVGPFLYPVIAVMTAFTSFLYPILFRSSEGISGFLKQWSPRALKTYVDSLGEWLAALQRSFQFNSPSARQIQHTGRVLLVNLVLMAILIGTGTFALRFSEEIAPFFGLSESVVGLVISSLVLALCVPSGIIVWRESRTLADLLTESAFRPRSAGSHRWRTEESRLLLRDSMLAAVAVLLGVWAVPLLSQLLSLGQLSVPVPVIFLAGIAFVLARSVLKLHHALEATLERTMLGSGWQPPHAAVKQGEQKSPGEAGGAPEAGNVTGDTAAYGSHPVPTAVPPETYGGGVAAPGPGETVSGREPPEPSLVNEVAVAVSRDKGEEEEMADSLAYPEAATAARQRESGQGERPDEDRYPGPPRQPPPEHPV